MVRLLVTGFDAFGGAPFNPAEAIVRRLVAAPPVPDFRGVVLPTVYDAAVRTALDAIAAFEPEVVLMIGLADRRPGLTLERFGRNRTVAAASDNRGRSRAGEPVVPGGAEIYATRADLDALIERLRAAVPDVAVSEDAGGYVCNHLYCSVLHALHETAGVVALFAHVPWTYRPRDAAGFGETPLDAHERVARALIAAMAAMAAAADAATEN